MNALELMDLPLIPLAIVLFQLASIATLELFKFLCRRNLFYIKRRLPCGWLG